MNPYFYECIERLKPVVEVLLATDSNTLKEKIRIDFNIGIRGLNTESEFVSTISVADFKEKIINQNRCYIMWDEFSLPVIKTSPIKILENFDDVTAVAFDTWIIDENYNWVIEINHEGVLYFSSRMQIQR